MLRLVRVLPSGALWSQDALPCARRLFNAGSPHPPPRLAVWGLVLQRAAEDQEKLREIVRDLKIHCDQVHCAPPLDVFNEMLRLCNYWHDSESLHKLVGLMNSRNMQVDKFTYAHLNEAFSYFPPAFSPAGHPSPVRHRSSSSSSHANSAGALHRSEAPPPHQHIPSHRSSSLGSSTAGVEMPTPGLQQPGHTAASSQAPVAAATAAPGAQQSTAQHKQVQQAEQQEAPQTLSGDNASNQGDSAC